MDKIFFPTEHKNIGGTMDQNFLRQLVIDYCKQTGIKKGKIAKDIQETPNNFSRWLTGKRNYGPTREQQLVDWLKERGALNE